MKIQEKNDEWYNNPNLISLLIIGIISLIILISQSFLVTSEVSALVLVQNILNHNITYMIVLVYFVLLQFNFGKKYFDYANVLMIIFFIVIFGTSLLTVLQSFTLVSLLSLLNNFLILVYFFHTFLRGTRLWKDFKLNKSLFNELSSEWYFNAILIVEITLYAVSLISTSTVDGTFLATFDCIYIILFARYIYIYSLYLDLNKINVYNNLGDCGEKLSEISEKFVELIDEVHVDNIVSNIGEKIDDLSQNIKNINVENDKVSEKSNSLKNSDSNDKKNKTDDLKYTANKNNKKYNSKEKRGE